MFVFDQRLCDLMSGVDEKLCDLGEGAVLQSNDAIGYAFHRQLNRQNFQFGAFIRKLRNGSALRVARSFCSVVFLYRK